MTGQPHPSSSRLPHGVSAAVYGLGLLALAPVWRRLFDADTGFHLAAGRYILAHRAVPATDPFSWTAGDHRWANLSWLYDVVVAAVDGAFGFAPVAGGTWVLFALVPALACELALRRGAGPLAAAGWSLLVTVVVSETLAVRPHILTDLFAVGTLWLVTRDRDGRAGLIALPALALAWVNVHGGFPLLFGVLGAFALEALLRGERERLVRLIAAAVACAAVLPLNPLGLGVLEGADRSLSMASRAFLVEWQPLIPGRDPVPTAWLVAAVAAATLGWSRTTLSDRLMLLGLLPLVLSARRHLAPAALLTTPALALAAGGAVTRFGGRLADLDRDLDAELGSPRARRVAACLAGLTGLASCLPGGPSRLLPGYDAYPLPTAPRAVYAAAAERSGLRLFNDFNLGGELLALQAGAVRPFVDGRADTAYPPAVMDATVRAYAEPEAWREVFAAWDIELALLHAGHPVFGPMSADPAWVRVARAGDTALFVRADRLRESAAQGSLPAGGL